MIELYHSEACPYCVKVREAFENLEVAYVSKGIPLGCRSHFKTELMMIGGKTQVPFLVDPERKVQMYESDDIIEYVREHYALQKQ